MTVRPRTRGRLAERRAISPLVGVLALLAITVCLAGVVAVGVASWSIGSTGPSAAFALSVDGTASTVELEHRGGDEIDVRELSVTVAVDGTDLSAQPPVPFVGASGFRGSPTGPFNAASDPNWRAGERASLTVADTNDPTLNPGDSVAVRLAVDGHLVAELEDVA